MNEMRIEDLVKLCLRALRILCGCTMEEFAKELDIAPQTYIRYESHKDKLTRMQSYAILYAANNLSYNYYAKQFIGLIRDGKVSACEATVDFVETKYGKMNKRRGVKTFTDKFIRDYGVDLYIVMSR